VAATASKQEEDIAIRRLIIISTERGRQRVERTYRSVSYQDKA
jgi:hypothetical protein